MASEVGVAIALPSAGFAIFLDSQELRDTGFALVNPPRTQEQPGGEATITLTIWDPDFPARIAATQVTLQPGEAFVKLIGMGDYSGCGQRPKRVRIDAGDAGRRHGVQRRGGGSSDDPALPPGSAGLDRLSHDSGTLRRPGQRIRRRLLVALSTDGEEGPDRASSPIGLLAQPWGLPSEQISPKVRSNGTILQNAQVLSSDRRLPPFSMRAETPQSFFSVEDLPKAS